MSYCRDLEDVIREIEALQKANKEVHLSLVATLNRVIHLKNEMNESLRRLQAYQAGPIGPRDARMKHSIQQLGTAPSIGFSNVPENANIAQEQEEVLTDEELEIVSAYNSSSDRTFSSFPTEPFGATNSNELLRSASALPTFKLTERGAYLLIRTQSDRSFVVPKLGLIFQDAYHKNGAMGLVFECDGYEPGNRYRSIELIRPAVFSMRSGSWKLQRKGKLRVSDRF